MNKLKSMAATLLTPQRRPVLIMLLGITGMVLIMLSRFTAQPSKNQAATDNSTADATAAEYAVELELKLTELVVSLEGVGEARVMVMLENTGEAVYAQEEKYSTDVQQDPGAGSDSPGRSAKREDSEQKYVLVDNGNGQKQPLITTHTEPKILGVVVICQGAEDILVQQRVVNVVTTVLHVPTTRVCVEKMQEGS